MIEAGHVLVEGWAWGEGRGLWGGERYSIGGEDEKKEGGKGKKLFLLVAHSVKPQYEKCMGHQSGTQLFAWLRGLKQCVQASLTPWCTNNTIQLNTAELRARIRQWSKGGKKDTNMIQPTQGKSMCESNYLCDCQLHHHHNHRVNVQQRTHRFHTACCRKLCP